MNLYLRKRLLEDINPGLFGPSPWGRTTPSERWAVVKIAKFLQADICVERKKSHWEK